MENERTHDRLLGIIEKDRDELVDLCLKLGNTRSPNGKERPAAEKVVEWLRENGIHGFLQPITDESCNAVGVLPGSDDGTSLILDAHIDTTGPELRPDVSAWVEGDVIFGQGVVNDKAQLCAFMIAARAIKETGIRLKGDLAIAGVTFETGKPSVDEFQGINYPGNGFGTKWLVDRGVTADYALVGETSGFGIVRAECGGVKVKVRVKGRYVYTPRMERGSSLKEHPDALVKMAHVLLAIEEWAREYEVKETREFPWGTIVPKARVIDVRPFGGNCDLHVDVYTLPGKNPREIQRDIQRVARSVDPNCEVSLYQYSRGYVATNAEPLIAGLERAHRYVFGADPPHPPSAELSMWRDLNVFNEVGIPSVCYGPARQKESLSGWQDRAMKISDLVQATKVYALTIIDLCGGE